MAATNKNTMWLHAMESTKHSLPYILYSTTLYKRLFHDWKELSGI